MLKLKKVECRSSLDGNIILQVAYVVVGKKCYFSGVNPETNTFSFAGDIAQAIANEEAVEIESLCYFDLITSVRESLFYLKPGEFQLEKVELHSRGGGYFGSNHVDADEPCPLKVLDLFNEQIGTKAEGTLGEMYREGFFKRSSSREYDQALADAYESLTAKTFSKEVFSEKWQNLLAVIAQNPNVAANENIGHLMLVIRHKPEVADEALLLDQIYLQIDPSCWDVWIALGSKYQERGNLPEARAAYLKSAEIRMATARDKNLPLTNVIWADAANSLHYAAEAERDMGDLSQAFIHALHAMRLLKGWGYSHVCENTPRLLGDLANQLGMKSLAVRFWQEADRCKANHEARLASR